MQRVTTILSTVCRGVNMTVNNRSRIQVGLRSAATCALILVMAGCAGAAASVDTRTSARSADEAAMFAGTWSGSFDASEFSGEMAISLTYESGAYSGSLTARAMGDELTAGIENFKSEGAEFTCSTFMDGADVYIKGKVEENSMAGTFMVYIEGNQVDEGIFKFVKK